MAPLSQEGGVWGDPPPHSRGLVGPLSHIYLSSPLNTILREGNGYAEGSPQHLYLIYVTSPVVVRRIGDIYRWIPRAKIFLDVIEVSLQIRGQKTLNSYAFRRGLVS